MSWQIKFYEEAIEDMENLDGSKRKQVMKGLFKVSQNPLPNTEGGQVSISQDALKSNSDNLE